MSTTTTTTTTTTTLAEQLRVLLAQAGPATVPGRLLAWWGDTDFPDGGDGAPALSRLEWEATYRRLENAAVDGDAVRPLAAIQAACNARPDGVVPIVLASFHVFVPCPDVVDSVRAAAEAGDVLRDPPASLADAVQQRRVFAASALLPDQWMAVMPVHRGRDVVFALDGACYLTNPAGPWPDRLEIDLGDGHGWRQAAFGDQLQAHYDGDLAEVAVRGHYGDEALVARFTLPISDAPAPPAPDDTWELRSAGGAGRQPASGRAWVYRAPNRTEIANPVILVEGFPGGHPRTYLYDLFNQCGTVDALRANGYDLVVVGLDNGLIEIQDNAGVLIECIREARRRTRQPLVVGGVSMGGVISRYALASMESTGEPHGTLTYLSIDAPHRGTYTTLGVQWFVHALLPYARSLGAFAMLLDSPSNQQLMTHWLHDGEVVQSELRTTLLDDLAAVGGYPRQPRRLAVSCGSGTGERGPAAAGAPTLQWAEEPFVSVTLNTLPGDGDDVVAEGTWLIAESPVLAPLLWPDPLPWETAPGSQNTYNADAAGITEGWGCGSVEAANLMTCCVPTVSALDVDADPFAPVSSKGPFDDHVCSPHNVLHLEITQAVSDWIVRELGEAPPPVAATGDAAWPAPIAGGAEATVVPPRAPAWNPAGFDPHDPAFLDNPYPTFARFRAQEQPVFFVSQYGSHWFFGYDDCRRILGDDATFHKQAPAGAPRGPGAPPANPTDALAAFPTGMFMADGDHHTKVRGAFDGPFKAAIAGAPGIAAKWAAGTLAAVRPSGHMELLADYALPVPANVLFDVLGIPGDEGVRRGLLLWETFIVPSNDITQPLPVRFLGGTARMALVAFLEGVVLECKQGGDRTGLIPAMCAHGATSLTDAELYVSCVDFVVAGYLSTTWLVASAVEILLRSGEWEALRRDPDKTEAVVDEVLRLDPPFQLNDRHVVKPITLCGVDLVPGDVVTAVVGSANRDSAVFAQPDALDPGRDTTKEPPLTFGAGVHYCIGQPLAKIMAPVMLRELMTLDGLELAGDPQWATDPYMRSMVCLPLRFRA
jgi:cytochrome P450/surfactin synthase thioesterase subunit